MVLKSWLWEQIASHDIAIGTFNLEHVRDFLPLMGPMIGCHIVLGQLIHPDKHGFLAIPPGDEQVLLDVALIMDRLECHTLIRAARDI